MLYIIIAAAGIISTLHFYGFGRFLELFETAESKPKPARIQEPPPVPWHVQEQLDRAELESQAYYILTLQGHTMPGVVKYTSNIELIQIINSYNCPNYKQGKKHLK